MSMRSRYLSAVRGVFVVFALMVAGAADVRASGSPNGPKGRLSANQFVSLKPFIIPMMPKDGEKRQFTFVVALELKDQDDRDYVISRIPLVRSRAYDLLFRLIAYRTQEPFVPSTGLIKRRMLEIAVNAVGEDKIASIIVQQVYQGRAP